MPDVAHLVYAGIRVYTAVSALGVLLGVLHLLDGWRNLRAVSRMGNGLRGTAWLWLGFGAVALVAQVELLVIGLISLPAPFNPHPNVIGLVLVPVFVTAALSKLAAQVAMLLGRRYLRGHVHPGPPPGPPVPDLAELEV